MFDNATDLSPYRLQNSTFAITKGDSVGITITGTGEVLL